MLKEEEIIRFVGTLPACYYLLAYLLNCVPAGLVCPPMHADSDGWMYVLFSHWMASL